ncbi:MAG: N-acetylgalactosamine 6-sulfate sulfatase [Planctomycetota bacterium]|nr:MAG: N-acetylgalactosamine 6-sulfate sulfatase [Planctomycetota bacterium]
MLPRIFCLLAVAALGTPVIAGEPPTKPNILFILVDDLGKEWIGCYGAQNIETPHIDALAASGMKFNNAWCMPQCTPTRVTLLTGQYPFRHGWTNHWDVPRWGAGAHFDPSLHATYANVLRDAGYTTCAAGKWQIDDFRVEPRAMDEAGFDDWCMWTGFETGNRASANRYWDPYIHTPESGSRTYRGKFGPDVYCDHLIEFIQANKSKPMLLYYAMALTHGPLTTTPDSAGTEGQREQFAAMVRYTDKLVGRLLAALEEAGIRDHTIVFFTTDNGTGLGRVTRNVRLGRTVSGGKAKMSEQNGTAQPFIVNCPGLVPQGVTTEALVDFTDILPTFAELGGAALPEGRIVDGQSFAPLLLGQADDSPRRWILSMGGGPAVLRDGRVHPRLAYDDRVIRGKRFKLWIGSDRRPIKLYDLQSDPWEEINLIDSTDPEAVAAKKRLTRIAAEFPEKDASPAYQRNPAQKWDKKEAAK